MPLFSWVQNKLSERYGNKKPVINPPVDQTQRGSQREEFSDWPQALLAIGTFGLRHQQEYSKESITQASVDQNMEDSSNHNEEESAHQIQHTSSTNAMQNKDHASIIAKKSLSFLLKKVLVCSGGFRVQDKSLRDHLQSHPRFDKFLKKILHKKIHPQGFCPTTTRQTSKYMKSISFKEHTTKDHHYDNDEDLEKAIQESKWVKTDTEYIVLEI